MKVFKVKVKPNCPKTRIISQKDGEIILEVAAPARDNKANIELVRFLSKQFKASVEIIRGLKSKTKLVKVS